MVTIDSIYAKYKNIQDKTEFKKAMREMCHVSEWEIRNILSYNLDGQSRSFRDKRSLALAELERRNAARQMKTMLISALFGLVSAILGVVVGFLLNNSSSPGFKVHCNHFDSAIFNCEVIDARSSLK